MTMMEIGTWLSIAVLGPGAIIVFIWFLIDLRKMMQREQNLERDQ